MAASFYNNAANAKGFQFRTNGNNTRMVLTSNGFLGIGTATPASEIHIRYGKVFNDGEHGLRIENTASDGNWWTLMHFSDDDLGLFNTGVFRGSFDHVSGEYVTFSDVRRKKDIETSPALLDKVMLLDIKKKTLWHDCAGR